MRERLLYVIGNLDVGGAERHLLQVLPELKVRGFNPAVYTLSWGGVLAQDFAAAGIAVHSPPFAITFRSWPRLIGRPLLLITSVVRYWLLLLTWRPALAHFFLPESYLLGGLISLVAPGLKRVMSRRSLNVYQASYPFLARVERWLHPRMNAVLGNAHAVTRQLTNEGVTDEHLGLIYNGLDLKPFEVPFDETRLREELGLPADRLVLILVANLIAYKGHEDLLRALGSVKDQLPAGWTLLCVGRDDGIGGQLKALAHDLSLTDHIRWLGTRQDVADLLRISDIGLLCSHQEGFSNSILEGMAASLPMIVTDVGGNCEAVVHGESGFVVPAHDALALATAITELALSREQQATMGQAGRVLVQTRFTIKTCVDQYENLYTGILENSPKSVAKMIAGDDEKGTS